MQCLNGTWRIARDAKNIGREEHWERTIHLDARGAPVPGIIQQVYPDYFGVAWYWRTFRPAEIAGVEQRCLLTFGMVDYLADVWVNGRHVGGHEGGETPFTLDITSAVKSGDNLLAVRVLNPTDEPIDGFKLTEIPHRNKEAREYQPGRSYNAGGIPTHVTLHVVPAVRISDVFVRPCATTGDVRISVTARNDTNESVRGSLAVSIGPANGGDILKSLRVESDFPVGQSIYEHVLKVDPPHLWNLDDPYLYRVIAKLETGKGSHEHMVRCGFRDFRVERGYFRLNGRRILLRSTHTGNHMPVGQLVPVDPDLIRRDLLMTKASGYNCVRFIAGMGYSEQMDFCDEIGLMVYEECFAGWCLADSPCMAERFDRSIREMILRDRNHPSITIWGLLNETSDGPVFRRAVDALTMVRELDDTRLVLLSSGRWDCHPEIGSLSNPGGDTWEYEWGQDAPDTVGEPNAGDANHGGYFKYAGDVHVYPGTPHPPMTIDFLRNLGRDTKPVFLSEYGVGSLLDVVRGCRWYEQMHAREDLSDVKLFRSIAEKLQADWKRWGFDGVYPFLQDMLQDSQRLHIRRRLLGFDLIRSNPKICGFNLTGMLDHAITGEGLWTFFREWKPGAAEALCDGWAPLRWCLFVDPTHGYSGRKFKLEAVLANEDALPPGEYPVTLRVSGKSGTIWEKKVTANIPAVSDGRDGPLAVSVFCGEVKLSGPAGEYEFGAYMERGGAPFGGKLKFHIADPADLPKVKFAIAIWGLDSNIEKWLTKQGVKRKPFGRTKSKNREVILVGDSIALNKDTDGWRVLAEKLARGSVAVFLSPRAFTNTSAQAKLGTFERKSGGGLWGNYGVSWREFDVPNVPKEEEAVFSKEFYGSIHYALSDLPRGEYEVELGMCEGFCNAKDQRLFDVKINDRHVLRDFDILAEAGGPHRAVLKTFNVSASKGKIDIRFCFGKINAPSVSRVRIFDAKGNVVLEDTALKAGRQALGWLPLENKGRVYQFGDWLYHKECVAKAHPIFEGLQAKGIMDWEYYGPVISRALFEKQDEPEDVIVAAFATGYCCPGGYASGVMMAQYPFGKGKFITNSLNILENVDAHPAADRLLLNMINYAARLAKGPVKPLPKKFNTMLKKIDYVS
ncbi:MAG: hypothetical protein JXA11_02680 [Phycisphaerae bacterium]|nr:hypothetical protein [Phycisphaerae bacterium]